MPKRKDIKKILVVGAGPIIIGQACEFDYSGTQACKALKDEGFKVILINSVQKVFHEPVYLNKWPFKDKISKIIFITKNIEKKEIEKTLSVLSFKQAKKRKKSNLNFSKKDYANFIKSMNSFDALKALDR